MNGENFHSGLRNISTYFRTCSEMMEEMKLQIASLQLKGIAHTWQYTRLEMYSQVMDRGNYVETLTPHITMWHGFFQALIE